MPKYGPLHGEKIPGGYRASQIQRFTPEQMKLYRSLFGLADEDSYLSRLAGGDEELFNEIEAPALRQFAGLQGGLASKFSGMGLGSRHSSGFANESNAAAQSFAQQLQAQRQGLQRQAISDLMGVSSQLLGTDPYYTSMRERKHHGPSSAGKGGWGNFVGAGIGGVGGFFAGGLPGAMQGAQLGYNVGSYF
jgi:hypothetical protein